MTDWNLLPKIYDEKEPAMTDWRAQARQLSKMFGPGSWEIQEVALAAALERAASDIASENERLIANLANAAHTTGRLNHEMAGLRKELERAAEQERERCAQIAEGNYFAGYASRQIAAAIRGTK